jgi:hypothetical protein
MLLRGWGIIYLLQEFGDGAHPVLGSLSLFVLMVGVFEEVF